MNVNHKPIVAAFDFDGTITDRDMLFYFILFSRGKMSTLLNFFALIPTFFLFYLKKISRQEAKERVMRRFFKGEPLEKMQRLGQSFAKEIIPRYVRREALKRLKWHEERGDECLIISATFDFFLKPWAESVKVNEVICSSLEVDAEGKVTGNSMVKTVEVMKR